jgi:hypothetical protein
MAFKNSTGKLLTTKYGEPYLFNSGDVTTSFLDSLNGYTNSTIAYKSATIGHNRIIIGDSNHNSNQGIVSVFNPFTGTSFNISGTSSSDKYGKSLAASAGGFFVGAPGRDSVGTDAGAVYYNRFLDSRNSTSALDTQAIYPSNPQNLERFGSSVAAGCGALVVGSPGKNSSAGAVYIWNRLWEKYDNNIWSSGVNEISAPDATSLDGFGKSVAVGCGKIVVSSPNDDGPVGDEGSIYIFDLFGNFLKKVVNPDSNDTVNYYGFSSSFGGNYNSVEEIGQAVAVGCGRIVVGASQTDRYFDGSAYILDLEGNLIKKISAPNARITGSGTGGADGDQFGFSVAVGNGRIIIGAPGGDGGVYEYDLDGNYINSKTGIKSASKTGYSVACKQGIIAYVVPFGFYGGDMAYSKNKPRIYTSHDLIYNEV